MTDFLHFCPSDGWFGDAMPVYANGEYHIYYTKLYKETENKPMSWGHIGTRDLLNYTEYPDPFPAGAPGTPYNTGCVFFKDDRFYAFYAGNDENGDFAMLRSESSDGITFSFPGEICFRRPKDTYRQDGTWRDPAVMHDPVSNLYRMVFCAKPPEKNTPDCFAGMVGQAVSSDLIHWECLPPLPLRGVATSIECPDLFFEDGRYYLGHYWHETRFRSSDAMNGPWERGNVISPDHFDFMAAKQLYDGARHILVGWLPRRNCDCMERIWGGNMLIPRELSFPDGKTPETRFVKELDAWFPEKDERLLPEKAVICGDGWTVTETGFTADAPAGGTMLCYPSVSMRSRIRFRMKMDNLNGTVILVLNCHPMYTSQADYLDMGYDLLFDASEHMIRLREHYMWDQRNDIAVIPWDSASGRETDVDIVTDGGILEVSVDRKQTLVSRMLKAQPGGLAISVQDTRAVISDFEVTVPENTMIAEN